MSPYMTDLGHHDKDTKATRVKDVFVDLETEGSQLPASADPFTVTLSTGFLPSKHPLVKLPDVFRPLQDLLDQMPIVKLDGTPGLLARCGLGPAIDDHKLLPDLTHEIDNLTTSDGKPDLAVISAAFRDYSFLASAYLLEPCNERMSQGLKDSGLGRARLPHCIAGPLVETAKLLEIPPYMSYAAAYALYNYHFTDPTIGTAEYSNLRLIRAFERGLDPASSEAGFILTHVDMVKHTAGLVTGVVRALDGISTSADRSVVNEAFELLLDTMQIIEAAMEDMWTHSKPKDYLSYRTFLFGMTNQSMFPNGVVYEDIDDNKPQSFRGESGANDAIIPLLDSMLEIPMPANPLTEILKDFRNYRPKPHREFLAHIRSRAAELGVATYCREELSTTVLYLRLLEHVRSFRWRHWLFAREYIIKRTAHPTASGGSPIITWLPNQLFAVMDLMKETWDAVPKELQVTAGRDVIQMMENVEDQNDKLHKEVLKYCRERGV